MDNICRNDVEELARLAINKNYAFPYLHEVANAHIDRFQKDGNHGRPVRIGAEIIQNVSSDFHIVFIDFWKRESIYGFGDLQLKQFYDKVMLNLLQQ